MSQSSPEGITLGKGSTLQSLSLKINEEEILKIPQEKVEHKGTVLTTKEVMKERSSAYEFIDFEETLKEAAEKYANQYNAVYFPCYESYLEGAEFAQKELYTKEDINEKDCFNEYNAYARERQRTAAKNYE